MPEIFIHFSLIVVQVGDIKRPLSRNVKLIKLWAENQCQRLEDLLPAFLIQF